MLVERNISEEWLWRTVSEPERSELSHDGNVHFLKSIPEKDNRILRVIVNAQVTPARIVTVFFDRRLARESR